MAGIDTSGWVNYSHVAAVTDEVITEFTANLVMINRRMTGVSENLNAELKMQASSLLSRQGDQKHYTFRAAVRKICTAEREKHLFRVFPAQISLVKLYDQMQCLAADDELLLIADHPGTRLFFFERLFAVMQGVDFSWGGGCREDAMVPACDTSKFVQTVCRLCMGVDIPRNSQGIIQQPTGGDLFDLPYGRALIRSDEHDDAWVVASAKGFEKPPVVEYLIELPDNKKQTIRLCHSSMPSVISNSDQNILHKRYMVELIRELGCTGDIFGGPGGKIFVYLGSTTINDIRRLAEQKSSDVERISAFFPDEEGSQTVLLMAGCPLGGRSVDGAAWDITGCAHIFGISPASPVTGRWLETKIHLVRPFKVSWLEKI